MKFIKLVLRERAIIAAVLTAVAVELEADLSSPSFHWRDLIIGLGGVLLRQVVSPTKPKE